MMIGWTSHFHEVDNRLYMASTANNVMKTDVKETDQVHLKLDIDLPGFKKDEINAQLDRWLPDNHSAAKGLDKDEKDKKGKYIRQ